MAQHVMDSVAWQAWHHNLWTPEWVQLLVVADGVILHPSLLCNLSTEEGWGSALSGEKCIFSAWMCEREQEALSNLYFSLGAASNERGMRGKTEEGGESVELIHLMAFVAHQTSHFSPRCLSSQPQRRVYQMKSYEHGNKINQRDDEAESTDQLGPCTHLLRQ